MTAMPPPGNNSLAGYQYRWRVGWDGVRLGPRRCDKADRADDAPIPDPFGAVLDDEGKRAYADVASGQPRAERLDDGLGGWREVL